MKHGVSLCTEDRLCPACYEQGVKAPAAIQPAQAGTASGATAVEGKPNCRRQTKPSPAAANPKNDRNLSPKAYVCHALSPKALTTPATATNKKSVKKTTAKSSTFDAATTTDIVTEVVNDRCLYHQVNVHVTANIQKHIE